MNVHINSEYSPTAFLAFKELNEEWITTYFSMEEKDTKTLSDPQQYILNLGGELLFAYSDKEIVGTCALQASETNTYELAKMTVNPRFQGKGIGRLLAEAAINRAKTLGANSLFLESNTLLEAAIKLYIALGFKEVPLVASPYARSNIRMVLQLQ